MTSRRSAHDPDKATDEPTQDLLAHLAAPPEDVSSLGRRRLD
ncbi:MAG: hypothetical protein ABIW49_04340 [Knoellia sp.]